MGPSSWSLHWQLLTLPYVYLDRTIQDLSFGKLSCLPISKFNPFTGVYACINITMERGLQNVISLYQINQPQNTDVVQTLFINS